MTVQAATVDAVQLISVTPSGLSDSTYGVRHVYHLSCSFPAYTGSTDSAKITGVVAAINAKVRSGRTLTWEANAVQALCSQPGTDGTQNVYAGTFAVSSADLTFNLTDPTGTELTSAAASSGVGIMIAVDVV